MVWHLYVLNAISGLMNTVQQPASEVAMTLITPNEHYQKGIIKEGYIGNCKYMFFDIWDVVSLYRKELETNPFKLYGLK